MNIQKLLRKLDKASIENKKQLLTVQNAYKLKTSESIGTLADQNEQSFVISDARTPQNNKLVTEGFSANSKLDQELSNIEKMKNLYESRQQRNRVRAKSIDRGSASGQKSTQKHLLKPSNTPSFSKVQRAKPVSQENDSACKNLYTEQILDNSQISQVSQNKTSQLKASKKNYFQYPNASIHCSDQEQQPYEEEPSYNEESLSQIANVSQDLPHDSIQKVVKKSQENLEQTWQQDTNVQSKKMDFHRSLPKCNCNCVTKEEVRALTSDLEDKLQKFALRLNEIEEENRKLRTGQAHLERENQQIRIALAETNNEKEKALIEVKTQQEEKQELQVLLKDVLYKREREKLQSSKENTFRENEKRMNNFSFVQTQSTNELKPSRTTNSIGPQSRPSESKMKVQNLLHKLQIKVDRS